MLVRPPAALDVAPVLLWADELPALRAGRHRTGDEFLDRYTFFLDRMALLRSR